MKVSIIDFGRSNLLSVRRAVEKLGYEACLARCGKQVREAEVLILPGVGAFADAMAALGTGDILAPLEDKVRNGVPLLGICLGMHLLFESGSEYGFHRGLGLIPGRVERIPECSTGGGRLPVPHIGWEGLLVPDGQQAAFGPTLLRGIQPGEEVYFLHSYAARPENKEHILAECTYGGHRLCAAVGKDNVYGTQFHPEKSGPVGLRILDAFLRQAK